MDIIETFYTQNLYPLPNEKVIIPAKNYLFDLGYKTGLLDELERANPFKIWIPGCGTLLPVYFLLQFPTAHIVATDISENSIMYVEKVLEPYPQLKERILLKKESIENSTYEQEFDYIVATGLLHHLENPVLGLQIIRRALKNRGILELMVYNQYHRQYYMELKKLIRLMLPWYPECSKDELKGLFQVLKAAKTKSPGADYYINEALELIDSDYATFLDVYLNPREISYSLEGLFSFLQAGGFKFLTWIKPELWELDQRVDDAAFLERYEKLTVEQRSEVLNILDYDFAPFYSLYALKEGLQSKMPSQTQELLINNYSVKIPDKQYLVQFNANSCEIEKIDFLSAVYDEKIQEHITYIQNQGCIALNNKENQNWLKKLIDFPNSPLEFFRHNDKEPSV